MDTTIVSKFTDGTLDFATVSSIVMGLFIAIQTIVRLTPTKKDDEIVGVVGKFLNLVFNKTNVAGSEQDKLRTSIAMSALAIVADKHPSARDEIIALSSQLAEKASKGEKITISNISSLVNTDEGKKIIMEVEKKVSTYRPKTKFGRWIAKIFKKKDK